MKRFSTFLMVALATMTMFSFSSCEEDEAIARTLEGTWEGHLEAYSRTYNGYSYSPTVATVSFYKDGSNWSTGTGYWMEEYDRDYWGYGRYFRSRISYNVTLGDINITFRDDGGSRIKIEDYSLSHNRFVGHFYENGQMVEFTLYHVAGPNWDTYSTWGWDTYDYYYSDKAQFDPEETK